MTDFFWGVIAAGLTAAIVVMPARLREWETEAVDRGLALYCPLDGEWAWKGECAE